MNGSGDTLLRQWAMLRQIPREPGRCTAQQITGYLHADGYPVTKRTVERDLMKLSDVFPYTCETEGRTNYWFWPKAAKVVDVPGMDPATALAFTMARDHLEPQLPRETLRLLRPYFDRADEVLRHDPGSRLAKWRDRVRVIPRGPRLAPPRIQPTVQEAVYEALLTERQLCAMYRRRGAERAHEYLLHPQALVVREGIIYLVAAAGDHDDPLQFALNRFRSARVLADKARRLPGFDLDDYIETRGEFGYPSGRGAIRLRALFDLGAAAHLRERKLADDQKLVEQDDGRVLLTATVLETDELCWWLLGFGDLVEVLRPVALRRRMAATLEAAGRRYA